MEFPCKLLGKPGNCCGTDGHAEDRGNSRGTRKEIWGTAGHPEKGVKFAFPPPLEPKTLLLGEPSIERREREGRARERQRGTSERERERRQREIHREGGRYERERDERK